MPTNIAVELARSAKLAAQLHQLEHETIETIARRIDAMMLRDAHEELRWMRGFGEGVLHSMAVRRQVLASYCLGCGDVYRIVRADHEGGLSHGYCRQECMPADWRTDAV